MKNTNHPLSSLKIRILLDYSHNMGRGSGITEVISANFKELKRIIVLSTASVENIKN